MLPRLRQVAPGPVTFVYSRIPSGIARWIPVRLRGWWAEMVQGFHAHGWSGKIYLLSGSVTWVTSIPMTLLVVRQVRTMGLEPGRIATVYLVFLLGVFMLFLYTGYRVLTGVARFHRRARNFAIFFSAFTAIASLTQLNHGIAVTSSLVLQAALSVQFIVYFLRNGERFLSSEQRRLQSRDVVDPHASPAAGT